MSKLYYKFILMLAPLLLIGCGSPVNLSAQKPAKSGFLIDAKSFPPLPNAQKVENGVLVYKIKLGSDDQAGDIWIYLPEDQKTGKLPAILITAAGSYLWNGTSLDEGDMPEHLPYVRKGYAVIAYETPGSLDKIDLKSISDAHLLKAVTDFKTSRAGLDEQQNALNYALDKLSLVDPERIFIAGHSSAATHALLAAANDPRIKAVMAYAPATDLEKRLAKFLGAFEQDVPGYSTFIAQSSPKNNIAKIKCPVFIFQSESDSAVPAADTKIFVTELKKSNANVTFETVTEGDHYGSMITQGIPKGLAWLNNLALRSNNTK